MLRKRALVRLLGAGVATVVLVLYGLQGDSNSQAHRLGNGTLLLLLARNGLPAHAQSLEDWRRRLEAQMLRMDSQLDELTCRLLASSEVSDERKLRQLNATRTKDSAELPHGDDCRDWARRLGFYRWPVTQQEESFPLAFSFKVHADPAMFERFLSVLWRPHNWYCVHVDKKTPDDVFRRVQNVTRCLDNVVMTSVRHNVVHASITSLYADLECAKLAVSSNVMWRYHISSCGAEFPLKTNLEMVQILSLLNGTNDIENYPPLSIFFDYSLLNKWELLDADQSSAYIKRTEVRRSPFQHQQVQIRKGSAYNSVTRPFLHWALTDKVNQDLLEWTKDAWAPDEIFWATLSYRPEAPGGPGVVVTHEDSSMVTMATIWPWDKGHKCMGTAVRSSCVFGSLDLGWLLSRHELLANKFSPDFDDTVLRCLEADLERRAVTGHIAWSALRRLQQLQHYHQQQDNGHRDVGLDADRWPLLPHLNRTLYMSLPHFSKTGQLKAAPSNGSL